MAEEYKVSKILKYTLLVFNFVLWVISCLLISVGVIAVAQKMDFKYLIFSIPPDPNLFRIQGAVMVLIGAFIFVICVNGTVGVIREDVCFLKTYLFAMIVIVVLEVIAGIVVSEHWSEAKKPVEEVLKRSIEEYRDPDNIDKRSAIDNLQESFKCCGISSLNDWNNNSYFKCGGPSYEQCGVPWSCCVREQDKRPDLNCGLGVRQKNSVDLEGKIYTTGCLDPVWKSFRNLLVNVAAAIAFSFIFPEIAGIVTTALFIRQIQKQINLSNNPPSGASQENGTDGQITDYL